MDDLSDDDLLRRACRMVPEHLHRSGRVIRGTSTGWARPPAEVHSLAPSVDGPGGASGPPGPDEDESPPSAAAAAHAPARDADRDLAGLAALLQAKLSPGASTVNVEFSQATAAGQQSVVVQLVDGEPTRVIQLG